MSYLDVLLGGYKTIQNNGSLVAAEPTINIIGATSIVDDSANRRTNVTLGTGITQLSGDVTAGPGSGSLSSTVIKANGASVPAAGSLTTGNVLQVSGSSALSYAPVNLAGGANYVSGTLPIASLGHGSAHQNLATKSDGSAPVWGAVPTADVVALFGADPTGVADSSSAIQSAVTALGGLGVALFFPAGTFKMLSTVTLPSDLEIIFSPGTVISGNITGSFPLAGSIFRCGLSGSAQGTTTLNGTPAVGSHTIVVTSASGAVVGGFAYLSDATTGYRALYKIELIVGTTLTLDRTIDPAFVTTDPVTFWNSSQVPQRIRIVGNGARVIGKAVVSISFQTARDCEVSGLVFDTASSTNPSDAFFGWNNACYNCVARFLHADAYGGGAPSVAFAPEAGDSCRFEFCTVENCAGYAMSFVESRNCTFMSCKAACSNFGFVWSNDLVTGYGSDFCTAIDCEAIGCVSDGFNIGNASKHATIIAGRARYNGGWGCYVNGTGGPVGADVQSLDAVGNTLGGLVVSTGAVSTHVGSLRVENNGGQQFYAQADCSVDSIVGTCTGSVGVQGVLHTAGYVQISKINITHNTGATAAYVVQSNGGNLFLGSGYVGIGINGDVGLSVQGSATMVVGGVTVAAISGATGTLGVYSTAGTTILNTGFDSSGTATPIGSGGGTVVRTYIESGALKYLGSSGTITTVGPA